MNVLDTKIQSINTFVFDIDGVITDGTVLALNSGEQVRNFYIKDGWAIAYALKKGYSICIISGGGQDGTLKRLKFLGIKDIFLDVSNKIDIYNQYCQNKNITPKQILYMGDDIPDLEVMQASGIATCPADAADDILQIAHYISPKNGGRGAVRDVIEKVLKAQNNWI